MVEIAGLNVLLVGEQRRQIVHQAVAAFDAAVSQGRPQLLVLSGGMGWGKTRLVQELYRQLALTRQDRKAPYWPADIVEQTETSLLTRRKHVYPVNPPVSGSQTMPWLWWGLSCALDARRLPLAAVTQGAPQFEVHARGILQRLKVRSLERDIAVDAAGVVFGLLPLPDVVGAVGDAWGLGKQLRERFAAARDASAKGIQNGPRATHRTEATSKSDIVQDLATSLRRLSSRDLPMVVVIDDAHFADPATVALIDSLLREEAHVLIVATAWPDSLRVQALEEQRTPTTERQTFGGWLDAAVEAFPERVSHVALNRLNDDDLGPVVLATAPRTGPEALTALVERADGNPLILRHLLELPKVRRTIIDDALTITRADVQELPVTIQELLQIRWQTLPEDVQATLTLASAQGASFVEEGLHAATQLFGIDGRATVRQAVDPHGWVIHDEASGEHRFTEQILYEVALNDDRHFTADQRRRASRAVADAALALHEEQSWQNRPLPARRRLLVGLFDVHHDPATWPLAEELSDLDFSVAAYDDSVRNIELSVKLRRRQCEILGRSQEQDPEHARLLIRRTHLLRWSDRDAEAVTAAEDAVRLTEAEFAGEAIHVQALYAASLAHRGAGHVDQALESAIECQKIATRLSPDDDESHEDAAFALATALDLAGRIPEAVDVYLAAAQRAERRSRRQATEFRARWLSARQDSGEDVQDELLEALEHEDRCGQPSPSVVRLLHLCLATAAWRRGDLDDVRRYGGDSLVFGGTDILPSLVSLAITDLAGALEREYHDLASRRGDDHPDVIMLRCLRLATWVARLLQPWQVRGEASAVAQDAERAFGGAHPTSLTIQAFVDFLLASICSDSAQAVVHLETGLAAWRVAGDPAAPLPLAGLTAAIFAAGPHEAPALRSCLAFTRDVDVSNGVSSDELMLAFGSVRLAVLDGQGLPESVRTATAAVAAASPEWTQQLLRMTGGLFELREAHERIGELDPLLHAITASAESDGDALTCSALRVTLAQLRGRTDGFDVDVQSFLAPSPTTAQRFPDMASRVLQHLVAKGDVDAAAESWSCWAAASPLIRSMRRSTLADVVEDLVGRDDGWPLAVALLQDLLLAQGPSPTRRAVVALLLPLLQPTTDTVEKSRACAPLLPVILENLEDSLRLPVAALFVRLAVEGLSDAAVATTMLRTALAGAVSSPDVRYGRPFARWLMRLGRLEQARDVLVRLREAVEEDADLTQTRSALWHDLGQTYSVTDLKERSHALHAYQQAAKLDPLSGSAASSLTALRSLASAASLANASEDVTWAASRALQLLHRLPDEPNVLLHLYELAVAAETHGADEAAGGMFVHLLGASVLALLTELPAVMSLRLTPAQEHLEQAVQTYARAAVRLRRRPSRDAVAASLALWDLLDDLVAGRTARALRGITNARRTLTKTLQGDSLPTEVADAYVTVFDSILTNLNAQQDISPGLPLRGADGDARTIALPDGAVYG